jgi:hypothetical protein
MPACDEGMELARRFLEAAGECVSTLGHGRTSSSRNDFYGPITRCCCIVTSVRSATRSEDFKKTLGA